jgi:hypothetical protein
VLVNLCGFFSPFFATVRFATIEERLAHTRDLLVAGQIITPWLSASFVVGAWHLAGSLQSKAGRGAVLCLALLLFLSHTLPLFLESPARDFVYIAREFLQVFVTVVFTAIVWSNLRTLSKQSPNA